MDTSIQPNQSMQGFVWTPVYSYFANMGGFDVPYEDCERPTFAITTMAILASFQCYPGAAISLPSKAEVVDKSKANLLVKLFAVSQITWLALSVTARGIM